MCALARNLLGASSNTIFLMSLDHWTGSSLLTANSKASPRSQTDDADAVRGPHASATEARQAFCARLKAARERKGITLATIAQATKVSESYFAGLEQADLGRWPKGIFRRAFVRDYIRMIGLPLNLTVDEFVWLFPDDDDANCEPSPRRPNTETANNLRITFAGPRLGQQRYLPRQSLAAMIDLSGVLLVAGILAWWARVDLWRTTALVALCYYPLTTACLGQSLTSWWMSGRSRRGIARSLRSGSGAIFRIHAGGVLLDLSRWPRSGASAIRLLYGRVAGMLARVFRSARRQPVNDPELPTQRPLSDARRVRAETPPTRLRLRIKLTR